MLSHYLDLRVLPDPETGTAQLLGALYDRVHLTFVQRRIDRIGVSFPGYSVNPRTMGTVLRLHAAAEDLAPFTQPDWLKGVRDHVRVAPLAQAPATAVHRSVSRKQFKTNVERLRRRRMRRKDETREQVQRAIPASVQRRPDLPFVHLHSHSTGQPFCLFLALGPAQAAARPGAFNSYGLSPSTTVPWF